MQSRDYGDSQIAWNIYRAFSRNFIYLFFWGGGGGGLVLWGEKTSAASHLGSSVGMLPQKTF